MSFSTVPAVTVLASALSDAGIIAAPVAAKVSRTVALPYSQEQSYRAWTAKTAEDKAGALWAHIAPMLSAYLVNGGSATDLRGIAKGNSKPCALSAFIHAGKTRRDRAAQATFALALTEYKARACEYDSAAHSDALCTLESAFLAVLVPADTVRAPQVARFTLEQVIELAQSGNLPADDAKALYAALSPIYSAKGATVPA